MCSHTSKMAEQGGFKMLDDSTIRSMSYQELYVKAQELQHWIREGQGRQIQNGYFPDQLESDLQVRMKQKKEMAEYVVTLQNRLREFRHRGSEVETVFNTEKFAFFDKKKDLDSKIAEIDGDVQYRKGRVTTLEEAAKNGLDAIPTLTKQIEDAKAEAARLHAQAEEMSVKDHADDQEMAEMDADLQQKDDTIDHLRRQLTETTELSKRNHDYLIHLRGQLQGDSYEGGHSICVGPFHAYDWVLMIPQEYLHPVPQGVDRAKLRYLLYAREAENQYHFVDPTYLGNSQPVKNRVPLIGQLVEIGAEETTTADDNPFHIPANTHYRVCMCFPSQ